MYSVVTNINNLLSIDLADRNSLFFKKRNSKLFTTTSLTTHSQNETSRPLKLILFLILLFTNKTFFNKLFFKQMILSSGLKRKELIHKSLLTINYFYKFITSYFSNFLHNQFMLIILLRRYFDICNTAVLEVKRFKKGQLLLMGKNFKIENNLSQLNLRAAKVHFYYQSYKSNSSKYFNFMFMFWNLFID